MVTDLNTSEAMVLGTWPWYCGNSGISVSATIVWLVVVSKHISRHIVSQLTVKTRLSSDNDNGYDGDNK